MKAYLNERLALVILILAIALAIFVLAFPRRIPKSEHVQKSEIEATNLVCFRPTGSVSYTPLTPLVLIETNTQVTEKTVQLAGLWNDLWPATYVYLNPSDLKDTMAQIKPALLFCAGITNAACGDMAVVIVDSNWTFTNTIGQKDMCQLLQKIPPHVLRDNK